MPGTDEMPEITERGVHWSWSSGCGRGCCTNYYTLDMPARFLYEENWYTVEHDRLEAERKAKITKKAEADAAAVLKREAEERAHLEYLKSKYNG